MHALFAFLGRSRKSVAALVTGVIGWGFLVVDSASDKVTSHEWMALAVALAVALGVYGVAANDPPAEPAPPAPPPPGA